MSIPLFLPHQFEKENTTVLAGDVGGTKTNLGVFSVENNKIKAYIHPSKSNFRFQKFKTKNISIPSYINL